MTYRLIILTELNVKLTLTGHDINELIACGDEHSTCQSYGIIDIKTGEVVFSHCNLPTALKKQAGGVLG